MIDTYIDLFIKFKNNFKQGALLKVIPEICFLEKVPMKAILLCIGDEILSGTTLDTNSNFISNQLLSIGIQLDKILTISDNREAIIKHLDFAFQSVDLVIATGGLGPTKDDKTKFAFAEYFGDELVFDDTVFENLRQYLEKRNRIEILDKNRSQAEIFKNGKVFLNDYGTAPALLAQKENKIAICLPGVPFEVKPLIKDKILPFLQEKFGKSKICSRILSVVGVPESELAYQIADWETNLPEKFALSYLPVGTRIKLKLTAVGDCEDEMNYQVDEVLKIIGENVVSVDGDRIEQILKSILNKGNLTISSSESCTGGSISKLITSIPGASQFFVGGICTYQTPMKTKYLGVDPKLIEEKSVVSAEVASAMSLGCQKMFNSDIAVSTTGVAGPNTDEQNNEIGLVYYSIRIRDFEKVNKLYLPYFEREDFMDFVAQRVLQDVVTLLVTKSEVKLS